MAVDVALTVDDVAGARYVEATVDDVTGYSPIAISSWRNSSSSFVREGVLQCCALVADDEEEYT